MSRVTVAVVLVTGTMTGCIFTDPINAPPRVEEIVAPPSISRGDSPEFTARTTDDQQEPPVLSWAHKAGRCPDDPSAALWPTERKQTERYVVPPSDTGGRFCVWVFATDSHRAVGHRTYEANPANHLPVAQIDVVSPEPSPSYRLFSDFRLSSARSSDLDQDPLVYQWNPIKAPTGVTLVLAPCDAGAAAMNQQQCFSAEVPGEYKVGLTVNDGFDSSAETVASFLVLEDQAPCLMQTVPSVNASTVVHPHDMPDRFEVSRVDDDGDPLPAGPRGQSHFAWALAVGDGPMAYYDNRDIPWLDIVPGMFQVGDTARVRVEINDRNVAASRRALMSCGDQDLCSAHAGCFQRVTWKIEYR
ncbi:MAG TPA: hypothetical protein VFH73_27925 [Polyangia bacterium]|nr:hypothetical protein [Polyangia bacterium]